MKRRLSLAIFCIFIFVVGCTTKPPYEYGVFLGLDEKESDKLDQYKLVVIEPSEFSAIRTNLLQRKSIPIVQKTVFFGTMQKV
ncbi:MAG: hypothetical protein WBH77_04480 [Saccharofermentanales bacterium]